MFYQISLKLHKIFNEPDLVLRTETLRVFEQSVCFRRQIVFETFRTNNSKIGLKTAANKFYHVNKLIGLDKLNHNIVHFKKLMKIQFLKYGKT